MANPVVDEKLKPTVIMRGNAPDVADLPVFQTVYEGTPYSASCWQFTREEIDEIARTGKVYLVVIGGHPPVTLATETEAQWLFTSPTLTEED